jgi:hypothetical protein
MEIGTPVKIHEIRPIAEPIPEPLHEQVPERVPQQVPVEEPQHAYATVRV